MARLDQVSEQAIEEAFAVREAEIEAAAQIWKAGAAEIPEMPTGDGFGVDCPEYWEAVKANDATYGAAVKAADDKYFARVREIQDAAQAVPLTPYAAARNAAAPTTVEDFERLVKLAEEDGSHFLIASYRAKLEEAKAAAAR